MTNIQKLENSISITRSKLISHPVYNQLDSKEKLISFMEMHTYSEESEDSTQYEFQYKNAEVSQYA